MTPCKQLNKHQPEIGVIGDCYRTAIACILDLQPDAVPHFCEQWDGNHEEAARTWLRKRDLMMLNFAMPGSLAIGQVIDQGERCADGAAWILGGRSQRGTNHSVVVQGGIIVCDPVTGGENPGALIGPTVNDDGTELWWIEFIVQRLSQRVAI
jgi:hypothetical protein